MERGGAGFGALVRRRDPIPVEANKPRLRFRHRLPHRFGAFPVAGYARLEAFWRRSIRKEEVDRRQAIAHPVLSGPNLEQVPASALPDLHERVRVEGGPFDPWC